MNKTKTALESFKNDYIELLEFIKARYPLFHKSNFFIRDFQFGIQKYLEKKEIYISSLEANSIAKELGIFLEGKDIFQKINNRTWRINRPEFQASTPGDPF
ncbi:MAG: hypothetical protein CO128_06700 [Ignavibacteriales bacterium CG_4_9_14_3_um_filter_30_11]|nr:MAG: hypothetical protein CO128_06700 [Ignavibacteriales bacterium CG_4_9_14_3_um_filter_30_11]